MRHINSDDIKVLESKIDAACATNEIPSVREFLDKHQFNSPFHGVDLEQMCRIFFYAWKDWYVIKSDTTLTNMIHNIFSKDQIQRDLERIAKRIPLAGKKVLDTGCCWGSVAYFLRDYDCSVSCIDYIEPHALFTKFINPQADVYQGDVRDMSLFEDHVFDVVISRGVIEHVGDYSLPRGKSTENSIGHQLQYLREMKRIVKPGGHIWLSTGNWAFPYDGEIDQWFFHWLTPKMQNDYLGLTNEGADKYWLLSWHQFERLFEDLSLVVEDVSSPDVDLWREPLEGLFKSHGRHKDLMTSMILEQLGSNPNMMSSWMITLKSQNAGAERETSLPVSAAGLESRPRPAARPVSGLQYYKWISRLAGNLSIFMQEKAIAKSGLFEADWYLEQYPDVLATGLEPLKHYLVSGWREQRDPAPWFSTAFYLQAQEVPLGVCPLFHYLSSGQQYPALTTADVAPPVISAPDRHSFQMMRPIDQDVLSTFEQRINVAAAAGEIPSASSFLSRNSFENPFGEVSIEQLCRYFFYTWKDMGVIHSESTLNAMINYIFDKSGAVGDIVHINQRIPLSGKSVLDVGCCWGTMSFFLKDSGCRVSSIDHVESHAMVTKLLNPQADVYHGDARNMHLFADQTFDVVIAREVIEHVGDYSRPRGKSEGANLQAQKQALREMKRVMKGDGYIWLSTNNYAFPFDNETNQWFFHWLPPHLQDQYLSRSNERADKYWRLVWEQVEAMFDELALTVHDLTGPDPSQWIDSMSGLFDNNGRQKDVVINLMRELMTIDPRFMSHWSICLKNKVTG